MKKYIHDMLVVGNLQINHNYFILELKAPEKLPEILPGQFVQMEVKGNKNVFLRRPISVHDVNYKENTVKFLIQKLGEGTNTLSHVQCGETVNIVYPLGNSFSIPTEDNILLVGGGCGVAPLLYLARFLKTKGFKVSTLIGGRSKEDILEVHEYKKHSTVYVTTQDGSLGERGLVTNHSILQAVKCEFSMIYTCGPEPMMRVLSKFAFNHGKKCEVSLENIMACGIGACLCCVVETRHGNKCTCTEGPIFNPKELAGWI